MFVTGLGTAVPPSRYSQRECWAAMQAAQQFGELTDRSHRILEKVLCGKDGIEHRHFAIKSLDEAFDISPDAFRCHSPGFGWAGLRRGDPELACGRSSHQVQTLSAPSGDLR